MAARQSGTLYFGHQNLCDEAALSYPLSYPLSYLVAYLVVIPVVIPSLSYLVVIPGCNFRGISSALMLIHCKNNAIHCKTDGISIALMLSHCKNNAIHCKIKIYALPGC